MGKNRLNLQFPNQIIIIILKERKKMYKDLKRATVLVEDLTDTLNNEDVCFADCINAIIKTANELDEYVE